MSDKLLDKLLDLGLQFSLADCEKIDAIQLGEATRLRGENAVLRELLRKCNAVLLTIEPDDAEEHEAIGDLSDAIERAIGEAGGTLL